VKHQLLRHGLQSLCIIGLSILGGTRSFETHSLFQDEGSITKQFVGMWRLVSWAERLADGTTIQSPLSVGYIIYTDTGHMCFAAMNPSRPKWKSAAAPTPEEIASGLGNSGFYAYCASVEVHAKEGFVLHHAEIDKSPNRIGGTRKRWFTFQGPNRIALRIDPAENNPPIVESTLIWERVQK